VSDRYDLVIVGGGAAGFTAGIYAARDRCRALLVERFSPGGQVLNCERHESARQLVSSAGDGATAALAAIRYLRTGRWDA
jgi:thioredoxin reductase